MNIEVVSVPANMTHFFQHLDLTVNREAKKFMKDQFTAWYSAQIHTQLDSGVALDDVDVDMRLSVLKPIHTTWLVSMFKAGYQLPKDGRRRASVKSLMGRNFHRKIPLKICNEHHQMKHLFSIT